MLKNNCYKHYLDVVIFLVCAWAAGTRVFTIAKTYFIFSAFCNFTKHGFDFETSNFYILNDNFGLKSNMKIKCDLIESKNET